MRIDRSSLFSALLGGLVVAVVMATLPAGAGNGDPMYVGQKNNAIRATKIISRGGLHLTVGKAGNPGLTIDVVDGTPPMVVNSNGLVANLNADLLDGQSGSYYRAIADSCADDTGRPPGTTEECEMSLAIEGAGHLYIAGSARGTGDGTLACWIEVDGFVVDGSERSASVSGSEVAVCASTVAYSTTTGPRTITFVVDPTTSVGPGDMSAWVIFLPA